MRGSLVSPDFGVLAHSYGKLRRVNLPAWRRFRGKRERAKVEEVQGLL
jgi:hypothetical protein